MNNFFYLDSGYLIFVLPALLFAMFASAKVRSAYEKYRRQASDLRLTGADVASRVLRNNNIHDINIVRVAGVMTDHYDSRNKIIALSDEVFSGTSIASIAIAAHEAGHAVQLEQGYLPLIIRHSLVKITQFATSVSYLLIILGFMIDIIFGKIGIIMYLIIFIFQVVTLPVEYNASSRALNELYAVGASDGDIQSSKKMLNAAALTYLAAMLTALAQLLRVIGLFGRKERLGMLMSILSFMKNQREIIYKILQEYFNNNNKELNFFLEEYKNLNKQEYGFIKTVLYGTIRYKLKLDYIIGKMSKIPFKDLDDTVINILRMSLYQIIYMDHIPDRAVVDEAVKLAKNYSNQGSSGFINGMLRNFIRNKDKYMHIDEKDKLTNMSIKYSIPRWIVYEIKTAYGEDKIEEILEKFNEEAVFGIRVTKDIKTSLISLINNNYKLFKMDSSKYGFIVENPEGIFNTEEYKSGKFYVQSESSQLVGNIVNELGEFNSVLELCASPGGKITHVHQNQKGKGTYIACDISEDKIKILKENLQRLNIENINCIVNDGRVFKDDFIDKFDLVILDAPCSGLGLIRKLPEIKYNKSKETLEELSNIQKDILYCAKEYLIDNGYLIYSTCTFTNKENKDL